MAGWLAHVTQSRRSGYAAKADKSLPPSQIILLQLVTSVSVSVGTRLHDQVRVNGLSGSRQQILHIQYFMAVNG